MTQFDYKPRRGFDIRIGDKKKKKNDVQIGDVCQMEGCSDNATSKVRQSPQDENHFFYYCKRHAAEHHKDWDFMATLSPEDQINFQKNASVGHRPTWKMANNARSKMGQSKYHSGAEKFIDPHYIFGNDDNDKQPAQKNYSRLQLQAFITLNVDKGSGKDKIREKYSQLVKTYHPDANGGDRKYENQLQSVMNAFRILRRGGIC